MALGWLVHYCASGEAACRLALPAGSSAERACQQRLELAVQLGKTLQRTHPLLFADPRMRFPLAVAHRKLGDRQQADQFFRWVSHTRPEDAWWACAFGERWIDQREGTPTKPVWTCARTAQRPYLDGHFEEAVWTSAQPIELKGSHPGEADWPASVMLAYDREFLYLAVRCRKAPEANYPPASQPRQRDADLAEHDRVSIFIDLDRDYVTFYELSIDHRGWPREECWGDSTWNPAWYVATHDDQASWNAEAAMAWTEISGHAPAPGSVWAAGAQRIVPGAGFQSWTQPADVDVMPEGFGYLVFE
jgi:hypothetical protein